MRVDEFKAWFEGFTESIDRPPSAKQWARIKTRVKEIDGVSVERHYIDRYWPSIVPSYPHYYTLPYGIGGTTCGSNTFGNNFAVTSTATQAIPFDGVLAMNALGRAEATEFAIDA